MLHHKKTKTTIATLVIWAACTVGLILWGRAVPSGDEMAYSFLAFYFAYPLASLASAAFLSATNNIAAYLVTLLYAGGGCLLPVTVFGSFDVVSLFFGALPAFAGLLLGGFIFAVKNKRGKSHFTKP